PLALPGGQRRRIAAQIGDKLHVVTEVPERELQIGRVGALDRSTVPTSPDDVANCRDIDANGSGHRHSPTPLTSVCRYTWPSIAADGWIAVAGALVGVLVRARAPAR